MSSYNIPTLEKMVENFYEVYNIELYFCEIMGNRWSFIAGDSQSYLPQKRVVINENLGIILDDSSVSKKDIENILKIIRKELE